MKIQLPLCLIIVVSNSYSKDCEPKIYQNLAYALAHPMDVRTLDLSEQGISTLDWRIGFLENLEELDLSHKQFSELPWEIHHLTTLKKTGYFAQ